MTQPNRNSASHSADVVRAEECDAAGQHGDAINHLVAGVRNHDVEAITRLGKRLLIGDRAPRLPNDAASFLVDASRRGGAEAAAILSVLYAVGANTEQGIDAAFESLIAAAERGWQPAQAQLAILAGEAPSSTPVAVARWRELAKAVDLRWWQSAPPRVDVTTNPLVRSFPEFIGDEVCRWLIERARGRLERALVYEAVSKQTTTSSTRTNTAAVFNLLETDFLCVLVQNRMAACLGKSIRHFEPMTVLHYDEGEEITDHFDFVDPNIPDYAQQIAQQGQRVVTFLIYLNDDYAAGETAFPRSGISHKGRRGEGLFFVNSLPDGSADVRTLHAGRPPRAGEKWIVSQFIRDRALF